MWHGHDVLTDVMYLYLYRLQILPSREPSKTGTNRAGGDECGGNTPVTPENMR